MIQGFIQYLKSRSHLVINEVEYVRKHILGGKKNRAFTGLWKKYPKLHYFLFHHGDSVMEQEVFGQPAQVFTTRKSLECRFDPAKKTVYILTYDVSRSGGPKVALDLLKRFKSSHNTVLFSFGGGAMREEFVKHATYCVTELNSGNLLQNIRSQLDRLAGVTEPALAILNTIGCAPALEEFARRGIPTLHLIHDIAALSPLEWWKQSCELADVVIFSAEFVKRKAIERHAGFLTKESYVLPQGVDSLESAPSGLLSDADSIEMLSRFRPEGPRVECVVIYGAGTVEFRKGVDLFLQCASLVVPQFPAGRIRFVWNGSGYDPGNLRDNGYCAVLQNQIAAARLGEAFQLLGAMKNLAPAYRSADLFFLSSRFDPLPIVAQRAMLQGLPVICFDEAGGIPEYLEKIPDAAFGVVPYLDTSQAAEKIIQLVKDKELRLMLGAAGRDVAREYFNNDRYLNAIQGICGDLIQSKSPSTQVGLTQPARGKL
jgi:glycosyltransferase involved in cell wall biosynthesis